MIQSAFTGYGSQHKRLDGCCCTSTSSSPHAALLGTNQRLVEGGTDLAGGGPALLGLKGRIGQLCGRVAHICCARLAGARLMEAEGADDLADDSPAAFCRPAVPPSRIWVCSSCDLIGTSQAVSSQLLNSSMSCVASHSMLPACIRQQAISSCCGQQGKMGWQQHLMQTDNRKKEAGSRRPCITHSSSRETLRWVCITCLHHTTHLRY